MKIVLIVNFGKVFVATLQPSKRFTIYIIQKQMPTVLYKLSNLYQRKIFHKIRNEDKCKNLTLLLSSSLSCNLLCIVSLSHLCTSIYVTRYAKIPESSLSSDHPNQMKLCLRTEEGHQQKFLIPPFRLCMCCIPNQERNSALYHSEVYCEAL